MARVVFIIINMFLIIKAANSLDQQIKLDLMDLQLMFAGGYVEVDTIYELELNLPLEIVLNNWIVDSVKCSSYLYSHALGRFDYNTNQNGYNSIIKIRPVADYMTGKWICTVQESAFYSSYKHFFLDVYIKNVTTPQILSVNHVILTNQRHPTKSHVHIAEYQYAEGDNIDVGCIVEEKQCTVQINYDYAERLDNIFKNTSSTTGIGYRFQLQAKHKNTQLICSCSCSNKPITKIVLTFVLQESFDNIMNLQIKNLTVRGWRLTQKQNDSIIYFNYAYIPDEIINMTCETDKNDVFIKSDIYNANELGKFSGENKNTLAIKPNRISKIKFYAKDKNNASSLLEKIVIGFTPIVSEEYGFLSSTLPQQNILIEQYTLTEKNESMVIFESRYLYYEFYDGDILNINCASKTKRLPYLKTTAATTSLNFNGTETNENYINETLKLTSADHNTNFECILYSLVIPNVILGRISILFRMKNPVVNDSESVDYDNLWLLIAVAIVMMIVCICVFTATYKMMKRNLNVQKESDTNNLQNEGESSIPAYPDQWDVNYANLEMHKDALYTKPVPKSQRKITEPDATYVNHDISKNTEGNCNAEDLDVLYATAEDLYKNEVSVSDKKYAQVLFNSKPSFNVSHSQNYVNTSGFQYVESAYGKINKK